MTPQHRLKIAIEYLKEQGIKLETIAEKLGYRTPSYIGEMTNGSKSISGIFLEDLEHEFSISQSWIESGEGEMISQETFVPNINDRANATSNPLIEINTLDGKKLVKPPSNENEAQLFNAFLAEKDKRQKESEERAAKLEQEKDMLYSVIKQNLSVIQQNLTILLQVTKGINDKLGGTSEQ